VITIVKVLAVKYTLESIHSMRAGVNFGFNPKAYASHLTVESGRHRSRGDNEETLRGTIDFRIMDMRFGMVLRRGRRQKVA
jgi:hypothetical protein